MRFSLAYVSGMRPNGASLPRCPPTMRITQRARSLAGKRIYTVHGCAKKGQRGISEWPASEQDLCATSAMGHWLIGGSCTFKENVSHPYHTNTHTHNNGYCSYHRFHEEKNHHRHLRRYGSWFRPRCLLVEISHQDG